MESQRAIVPGIAAGIGDDSRHGDGHAPDQVDRFIRLDTTQRPPDRAIGGAGVLGHEQDDGRAGAVQRGVAGGAFVDQRLIPTARDTDSPPDSAGRESTIRCSPT